MGWGAGACACMTHAFCARRPRPPRRVAPAAARARRAAHPPRWARAGPQTRRTSGRSRAQTGSRGAVDPPRQPAAVHARRRGRPNAGAGPTSAVAAAGEARCVQKPRRSGTPTLQLAPAALEAVGAAPGALLHQMVERVRRARWRDCPALKEAPGPPTGGLCHGGGAATENRAYAGAYFRARLQPSGNGLGRIAPHSGGACPQPLPRRIRLHRRRADVETAQWIRAALLGCSAFVRAFAGFACSPKFTAKQDTFSEEN